MTDLYYHPDTVKAHTWSDGKGLTWSSKTDNYKALEKISVGEVKCKGCYGIYLIPRKPDEVDFILWYNRTNQAGVHFNNPDNNVHKIYEIKRQYNEKGN